MTEAIIALGAVALGWLTLFQILLAFGLPLGRMAWGGANRVLPGSKRVASLLVAGLTVMAAACLTDVLGLTDLVPGGLRGPMLWGLAGLFSLSTLANLATSSRIEKLHGAPLAAVIALACLLAALG